MKKNNKSFNSTWSDEDFEGSREYEDHVIHHVVLTTRFAIEKTVSDGDTQRALQHGPKNVQSDDLEDVPTLDNDSSVGEELTDEVIMETYKNMYHKWMQLVKLNEKLSREKEDQAKKIKALECKLAESKKIQGDLSGDLEHMKKTIRMLNSGTSKLDQIFMAGKTTGNHMGLGYIRESSSTKTIFVPAAKMEKLEVNQRKTRIQSSAHSGAPGKKWVPVCHTVSVLGISDIGVFSI